VSKAVKAAKVLGLRVFSMVAYGTWRTLEPVDNKYVDYEGPFPVKQGVGPAFVRADGAEVFMLGDSARVVVTFEEQT